MPPFLQFRLWLRESPTTERVLAGLTALVVLVLVVVALVPVARGNGDDLLVGATSPGAARTTPATDTSGAPSARGRADRRRRYARDSVPAHERQCAGPARRVQPRTPPASPARG